MDDKNQRYDYATKLLREVGHDLKSPLTAIIGTLEALSSLGSKISDSQKDILYKTGLKEAYRLQHFIQNILILSRIEFEGLEAQKSETRLDSLVSPLRDRLSQQHPHVTWNAENDNQLKNHEIVIDARWMSEALWQLLDNVGRHNPNPVSCTISLQDKPGESVLVIADNGTGIPADLAPYIFEKHFKGPTTQHQDASAGVGLTLAKRILEAHNGKLDFVSANDGAQFVMVLPKK